MNLFVKHVLTRQEALNALENTVDTYPPGYCCIHPGVTITSRTMATFQSNSPQFSHSHCDPMM